MRVIILRDCKMFTQVFQILFDTRPYKHTPSKQKTKIQKMKQNDNKLNANVRNASSWMHPGETHLAGFIYTDAYMDASFDSAM